MLPLTKRLLVATLLAPLAIGCAPAGNEGGTGGAPGSGGTTGTASGGATGSGGASTSGGAPGSGGAANSGGAPGSGGASTSGGAPGSGGATGTGGSRTGGTMGSGGMTGTGGSRTGGTTATGGAGGGSTSNFSFFLISLGAVRTLSGSQDGFGGDLQYGETGAGAGLRGADKICAAAAERAQPGSGSKAWRAFLSAKAGGTGGGPVHAKDRVGTGPWYDAMGRLVASNLTQLLMPRPGDAAAAIKDNLPNEYGVPNGMDGCTTSTTCVDNHQVITGTNDTGMLYTGNGTSPMFAMKDGTCGDWTKKTAETTYWPWCGHSWSRQGAGTSFNNWMSSYNDAGCVPCARVMEAGGVIADTHCIGSAGGYGGFYCLVTNAP